MKSERWVLVAAVLGSSIVFLDSTVVNVALPTIGRELSSSLFGILEGQSYVYYGYLLTLSALLILAGAAADRYGRRRMFVIGLVGFGVTSVLCGLAPNLDLLILFRLLQGAAGAILVPGSLAIIVSSFTGAEQGRAFGIWAGASAFTAILGPALGGALISQTSWRSVFLINVPLVLFALWAARHVEESRDPDAPLHFDRLGAMLVVVAIGGLTFGVIRGESQDWQGTLPYASIALGFAGAVAFVAQIRRSPNPLVPPHLFRSRNFTVTNISTFLIYGALYVMGQFMALYIIGTLRYNELAFGLAGIPGTVFLAFFSGRFGALAAKHGPRLYMTLGPAVMGAGLLWFARIPHDSAPWIAQVNRPRTLVPPGDYLTDVLPAIVVFGIGLMIMVAPLTTALMRSVPVAHSGVGSAVNNAISRVGPQLIGALLFVAISGTFYSALAAEVPGFDSGSERLRSEVSPLNQPSDTSDRQLVEAARRASTRAFHVAMGVTALLCFVGAAVNGVGIRNDELREDAPSPESPPGSVPAPAAASPS